MQRNGEASINLRVSGVRWSAILLSTTSVGCPIASRSSASSRIVRMRRTITRVSANDARSPLPRGHRSGAEPGQPFQVSFLIGASASTVSQLSTFTGRRPTGFQVPAARFSTRTSSCG